MNKLSKLVISLLLLLVGVKYCFSIDDINTLLNQTKYSNLEEKTNAFWKLSNYSTNEQVKIKMYSIAQSLFDDRLDGKIIVNNENTANMLLDIMGIIIKFQDKRALPAIIAGTRDLAWGFVDRWIVPYKNEAVPYFVEALKEEKYYGNAMFILERFLTSTNIQLTDSEKKELSAEMINSHYNKHIPFDEGWLSSLLLVLSVEDEKINKYALLNNIESVLTNSKNEFGMGYVPVNLVKIKEKRIKNKVKPIINKAYQTWINSPKLDEKTFKASLSKNFSAAKKTELYNRRKAYLEGERRKVVTELSNTLVELEKE